MKIIYKIKIKGRWRVAAGWRIEVALSNPRGMPKVARETHNLRFHIPRKQGFYAPPATFFLNYALFKQLMWWRIGQIDTPQYRIEASHLFLKTV